MNKNESDYEPHCGQSGVSQSTVSLVLNGSYSIKLADDTREKVLRIAQEMGYVHKAVERPIARDKIALIINGLINHDPFIEAISAVQQAAWQHNKLLAILIRKMNQSTAQHLKRKSVEEVIRGNLRLLHD